MKRTRWVVIISILVLSAIVIGGLFRRDTVDPLVSYDAYRRLQATGEMTYSSYREQHAAVFSHKADEVAISMVDAVLSGDATFVPASGVEGYEDDAVHLDKDGILTFDVTIEEEAAYVVELDAAYVGTELFSPKFGITVDGDYPFYESRQVTFPIVWLPGAETDIQDGQTVHLFNPDRYGNDVQPRAELSSAWAARNLYDSAYYHADPLRIVLTPGTHTISLTSRNDNVLIGSVRLVTPTDVPDYDTYLEAHDGASLQDESITVEAEYMSQKSDPSIKLYSDDDAASTPQDLRVRKLNAIDAYTWDEAGRSATWTINVEEEGFYHLSLKYIQYRMVNIAAFRRIEVNGKVPFKALEAYAFPYSGTWANETLRDGDDPYRIYFKEGENTLTLTSVIGPYLPLLETFESVMRDISDLSIDIRKLTGGNTDMNRDWNLTTFIPDLEERLNGWADELEESYRHGHAINNTTTAAAELVPLKFAFTQLRELALDPDDIPNRMSLLSEGSRSASQYLGNLILRLSEQSMGLEKIHLSGDPDDVPNAKAPLLGRLFRSVRLFFLSFERVTYESDPETTIEVWVNRPRANIDLMQKMIDEMFTPETGIHVNLSLMPNPTKLILSNAAGIEPDVAMGVSGQTPYEFAIRNAAVDLRQFEGYEETVSHFAKGAMVPYVFDDGVYGLPETQDFYVSFYRTDIMSTLGVSVPDTWGDVTSILPALRRYGMNYYVPLSSANSYKGFNVTTPYFAQNGASFFAPDGMSTALDSDASIMAMTQMTGLFTIHDMPVSTPNFYNHFRYGTLPVGISNSGTYIQLLIAAPEIKGNWDIAPHPGTETEDGTLRYAPAPTTATMMFSSSDKQEMAFRFLSWWHSTDIQILFASDVQRMFGKEYMWFSSNLEALESLPIDPSHRDVILTQLEWAYEAPNVPGGYFVEREISNAWNRIVIDDDNIRNSIDLAVKNADREMARKMTEFGFMVDGVKVRDYPVPTLSTIDRWLKERQ
jgi:ABC-type glycerol-3-phosphate transport system substrate-binding protein